MPAGDGTGPGGLGPRTGRGMGFCGGYDVPGWATPGRGRLRDGRRGRGIRGGRWAGYGPGRGGGGWGWRQRQWGAPPAWAYDAPYAPPSQKQEVEALGDEAEWLKEQLEAINRRMDELNQE